MPRPMLRTPQNQTQSQTVNNNILSATRNQEHEQQQQQMDKMKLDQLLRKKRSKEYMEALHKLDAGGHVHNQHDTGGVSGSSAWRRPAWICFHLLSRKAL